MLHSGWGSAKCRSSLRLRHMRHAACTSSLLDHSKLSARTLNMPQTELSITCLYSSACNCQLNVLKMNSIYCTQTLTSWFCEVHQEPKDSQDTTLKVWELFENFWQKAPEEDQLEVKSQAAAVGSRISLTMLVCPAGSSGFPRHTRRGQ